MATLSSFKQQNVHKIGVSSMLTEEQQKSAITKAAAEEEEKKNQGGFFGGIGYAFEKLGLGFLSGIEGIWDYTAGGLAKLFGADDWAEQQIANDWVNYNHADEWYNPSDGWKMAGDVAGGIGTSAPAMLAVAGAGAITALSGGTLAPLAATLIAGGVAGLGSAGRATKEAYDQTGELGGKEFGYGALSGFTEGAMESVSTALGAGIGAVTKNIAKSFGKEVAKSATRNTLLKGVVKGFAGEAFEEGVQAILEPYYKRMTYDPNAKNATVQEVAYAALVGGLSGAIMGGGDVAVRNIRGTTRGNTLVNEGKAGDVITTAEQISSYQTENQTDYETFQIVQNTLDELKTSLQKTGGEVSTVRQKMLLGVLEQANTSAAFEPIVTASAENIYNNAETVAARLNELGYQDQNGKPIQVTAEQIREGIDNTKGARTFRKTMSKALKTNSVLRTLAVADTVGQVSMDTARFRDATLAGQQLSTQADLNRFVEQATDAERQAVADRLGIENWETLTNEQFHDKITEFVANGGVQEYQQERSYVKEAQAVAPETARKHLPRMVNLRNDGTYRYTQGGTDIAITKRGDSYYVYDYESGLMSKALSRTETNRVLREIHTNEQNYQNGVRQHTEAQNRLREQAAEIDTYARENISEYKNLSATGQAAIRATIRQGRAAGIPEADTLMYARVAAHSGVAVIFDKELCFVGFDEKTGERKYGDGFYDPSKKRIVVNPQGKRSAERLLLHEMTHVVYNGEDGVLTVAEGVQSLTEEERETIIIAYTRVGRGSAIELSDEMNAHFAEKALSNKNILERLVQKKQTLKEKILGFFKKARTDYQSDEKLTGAAARLYRQYKKLFDEFSARNQRYLGVENASEQAVAQAENEKTRLAMRRDADGNAFVEVSPQVADSVESPKQIAETLAQIVRTKFSSFIDVHGQNIGINQRTAREWLRSKSAEKLLHTDSQAFLDKVNAFENADELLKASKEYVGEAAKHSRKDNFVEFARGIVAFKVGDNGYEADIIVGTTKSNTALLYDVVNIQHKEIVADTTDTAQDRRSGVSATTNSISQNRENVNPESQKGKKFALAGETSETADLSMLDKAKQLQAAGEDSETIRKETGWFVGYDNQWRYEIDDSAATLVEKPAFENHSTEDGGYRTAKLGDIMQHEKLYAAYPFLKDITVILQETDTGVDGSAFAEDGQIVLDQRLFTRTSKEYRKYLENRQPEIKRIEQTPEYREYNRFYTDESLQETLSAEEWLAQEEAARNKFFASELGKKYHELMWGKPNVATTEIGWSDKAKSVLMHEVQHLIQAHEGFASGSSETYWYNRLLKQYRSEAATVREKFLKLRMEAAPELQQAMYDMEDVLNRFDVSTSSIAKAYDNAAQYAKNDRQRDILWDYTQAYSKLADFYKNGRRYADDMYTNTAGEIEARDVSSRLEMTAEQRRETRPDIDRRKVYFSEKNGGGDSHSYALPDTDSDGGKLTAEQREFFGKSAIVDADGKLLKMYHGTAADFTVFDLAESGASNDHTSHIGFWFTPRKAVAENFADFNANDYQGKKARVQEVYLNIENPKIYAPTDNSVRMEELRTENTRLREQLTEEYAELKETVGRLNYMLYFTEDNIFGRRGENDIGYRVDEDYYVQYMKMSPEQAKKAKSLVDEIKKNNKQIKANETEYYRLQDDDSFLQMSDDLDEFMEWITGTNAHERGFGREHYAATNAREAAEKFRNKLIKEGYDGIWIKDTRVDDSGDQVVAFSPEQIKLVTNKRPTKNVDIRYALPELEQEAVKHFGHTYSWAETGYVLTDGSRLDFSGRHEGSGGGGRYEDHRDIAQLNAYSDLQGTDAMIDFMRRGNIRVIPEVNGINLSVRPTRAQENTLADFISRRRGEVTLDIDNERGETVVSVEYPRGTHSNKVLQDIRNYFDNGTTPTVSEVQRFRYALPETDSDGRTLTPQQREFFKDSKVVDDNGKLRVMYHGSNAEFSVFDESRMSSTTKRYMAGFYFTAEKRVAEKWSRYRARTQGGSPAVFEVYLNIKNPLYLTEQEYKRLGYDEKYRETVVNQLFENQNDGILISPEQERISGLFEDSYNYELDDSVYYQSERYGITDKEYAWWLLRAVQNPDFTSTQAAVLHADQVKLVSNKQPTSNADMRFALSDSVVNVDSANETAAWTSERVTDLIDRYGATNPRYTQAYATWINPADFVKATTVNQTRRNQIYDEAGNLDIDRLSRETQTPFLDVDYDTMRIVSHEGRHRMAALAKAGVKRVAVAIRFTESSLSRYDARIMEGEHKFKGQSFSNGDTATQRVITRTSHNSAPVGTLVPINAAYSAQLSEFTSERGVRFALDSSEDGNAQTRGNYSVGQRARFAANNTGMRVYTKAEAAEVINSIIEERLVFEDIGMYGELRGKDRQAVIDYLFRKLNTVKEGYRGGVALRIADYMIEHTVLTDMYAESNGEVSEAMRKLSVLRRYMHKIDLRHIQGEIQYRFDKKNSINLVWGAKEGGIAPDTLPQLLAEEGIFIDAVNEADCFLQMVEMYEDARAAVNNATESVMLSTYGDARTIKNLRQQIARDVLNAYEQKGRKSKYAKLVEKYTKQIAELKQRLREANANNRLINSIVDQAQKMRDLKLGTFQNATQYDIEIFRSSIEKLGKIKFRGNFNIAGTRKIMADLLTWYTKENPLLADTYEQGIADMLYEVANGKTNNYTKSELQSIRNIMVYFTNYVEHFNKVYRQGKWIDAVPEATRYIDILHRNEDLKSSWFMRKVGSSYLQTFGDPLTVMRRMDRYESGFYTETFSEFREAKIDAEIAKMQLMEEYEVFLKKNKNYLSKAVNETVQYRGVEIPKMQLISLYMTLKRQHAQAGLAENGFGFWNAQDQRVRVDGFAKNITEESELRAAAVEEQSKIAELLTETDKEYIAILEKGYQEAGRLKAERDIQRLGFTNATEDYYYPIRRGNIAKNVDSAEMQQELDRISNASFNKDTVRGAKQELFIESADVVFNRHVRGVVQYAYISPAIETYNKLFNLDIAGNPNKPVSVSTESANVWKQGNDYFKKLITDIQGISPVSSEGRAVLSYIRGSYAKFQLGANPKVWVTQLSSLFASSSILDASSITRGMAVSAKDVDTYCPLAKLRAQDNTAAMAQGVLDKVGRIGNALMAPIGKMDRFVVRRLFGACQVQVQKNGGAKIGTEANKIEAGKLLKQVILETQQNSLATERSAAMRSGNEIMRTLTMFSADSMKVIGRVIDSVGELSALKAKLRTTTDTESRAALQTQIKAARRNVCKSITALATSALFMAAVAQLFNWLYNKDRDDDETAAEQVLVDFTGNLLGGLPLIRDFYSRLVEGYSIDNYAYSTLNDMLDSAVNLFDSVAGAVTGEESNTKMAARIKNLIYSIGQLTGIPTRNLYNVFYGLTKRISPTTAYKIDEAFYAKNYVTDLNKAIEDDDTDMTAMLMSLIFNERMGNTNMSDSVRNKFVDLYSKGYSVLPRSIGDTITYGGVDIALTEQEYNRFRSIYAQAMKDLESMINGRAFAALSDEDQAQAIKQVYDAYYYDALSDLVGVDERTTLGELSDCIDMSKLSVAYVGLSDIESDKTANGDTISGSKKKNTIEYLLNQNLTDGERLLILAYRGYTMQDGDYKGYTAKRAKRILLQYILKLNGTQTEKATLAEKCGFTVRNGRIIRDF